MTKQQAIEILLEAKQSAINIAWWDKAEALQMAIKALMEVDND